MVSIRQSDVIDSVFEALPYISYYHPVDFVKALGEACDREQTPAAYLVSKAIRKTRIVAFEDLGMEAIREFVVEDMPVTVAVDASGESVHHIGPAQWRDKFPVAVA